MCQSGMMMNMERRNGEMKPVIRKHLLSLTALLKEFVAVIVKSGLTRLVTSTLVQFSIGATEVCDRRDHVLSRS